MDSAIKVTNLSKKYLIGNEKENDLKGTISNIFKSKSTNKSEFWALNNLSFEVQKGELFGIIGKNGAGKSTLLKILSQITKPTNGKVEINGRIASLLEVGTGFHPELTGRENVFLNGTILGMTRKEVKNKFDEIIEFSGVEKFIDTPVKHYSSGMYVRLAFAVAAHLEPDILIIDEVLAVGDSDFQKKCLGKMGEVANSGRTVLFVSHNMQAVSSLTKNTLLLSNGQLQFIGPTNHAIQQYFCNNDMVYENTLEPLTPVVTKVKLTTSEGANIQQVNKDFNVEIEIYTPISLIGAAISFQIIDNDGTPIIHVLNLDSENPFGRSPGTYKLNCNFPKLRLYPGNYSLIVYFAELSSKNHFETLENICPFEVVVLHELRDYYWIPNHARYVDEHNWQIKF